MNSVVRDNNNILTYCTILVEVERGQFSCVEVPYVHIVDTVQSRRFDDDARLDTRANKERRTDDLFVSVSSLITQSLLPLLQSIFSSFYVPCLQAADLWCLLPLHVVVYEQL